MPRSSRLDHYPVTDAYSGPAATRDIGPITYRPYQAGDEASILDGFNETFGVSRGLDYWHWKFNAEPYGRFSVVAVDRNDHVLATFSAVPVEWTFDGRKIFAALGADVYCKRHPELIRRRVFLNTMREFVQRYLKTGPIEILFGFAGDTGVQIYQFETNKRDPRPINFFVRRRGSEPALMTRPAGFDIRQVSNGRRLDTLVAELSTRYPRALVRSADWAEARFFRRPDMSYSAHVILNAGGAPVGWFVTTADGDTMYLCDLIWNGDRRVLDLIDTHVANETTMRQLEKSATILHGDPAAIAFLEESGWRNIGYPNHGQWHIATFDPSINADDLVDSFYLTYADTDLI